MKMKMFVVPMSILFLLSILSSQSFASGNEDDCGVTKTDIVKGLIAYVKGSDSINSRHIYTLVKTYSGYEDCGSSETTNAILAVSKVDDDVVPVCSDGTMLSHCSTDSPKYCQNGELIDRCDLCCESGKCNSLGTCVSRYAGGELTDCKEYGADFFCGTWNDFVTTCNSGGRLLSAKINPCSDSLSGAQYCMQCIDESTFADGDSSVPDVSDMIPEDISDMIPDVSGEIPDVSSDIPDVSDMIPDVSGDIPDVSDMIPEDVSGMIPDVSGEMPDISDMIPDISEIIPEDMTSGCTSCGEGCTVCVETSGNMGDVGWEDMGGVNLEDLVDMMEGVEGASSGCSACEACGGACGEMPDIDEDVGDVGDDDSDYGIADVIGSIFGGFGSFLGFR